MFLPFKLSVWRTREKGREEEKEEEEWGGGDERKGGREEEEERGVSKSTSQ